MSAKSEASPGRAVAFGAAGVAVLCMMDACIKHLVAANDTLVVTLGRYVFATLFAALIWLRAGSPTLTADMWRIHSIRGVVIALSATCFFWSLKVLPLAEAVTISFIAPLLIPFFARALLGEKIRPRNFLAGLAGFGGVLISALGGGPNAGDPALRLAGVSAVLGAAVAYALSLTLLRGRADKDGPEIVGLFAALVPGLIVAGPAFALGSAPPLSTLPVFIAMGLFGAVGMYLLAKAYAAAEAQILAPLEYTALIWAALFGYALFNETPHPATLAGAAIIIAACLWGARPSGAAPASISLD